jgi:hypothetical protein
MKLILPFSKQLSGLKINFPKNEFLFCFGKTKDDENYYRTIFSCEVRSLQLKYLGTPIHYMTLLNKNWKQAEDQFKKKLAS